MTFEGKLLSVSDTVTFNKLSDGKQGAGFIACTIEFKNRDNEIRTVRSSIYEKEWDKGMEVGKTYIGYVEKVDDKVYSHLTHYIAADTMNIDDFDFETEEATKKEKEALAEMGQ